MEPFSLAWWIQVFVIPAVGALIAADMVVHRAQQKNADELHKRISDAKKEADTEREAVRRDFERRERDFYEFRLQVASNYATLAYAREIEARFTSSFQRLEIGIDKITTHIMKGEQS